MAARGARDMDRGVEPVADPEERRLLRGQAARVHVRALILGALLTGLSVLGAVWLRG